MTNEEKENLFYDFVKQHEQLEHLTFGDPVEGQQWIGVLAENIERDDGVVIDPNWDGIYEDFTNSVGKWDEAKEYIETTVVSKDTSKKMANYLTKVILDKLKADNIQSEKVYVSISSNFTKTWFDSVEEV